MKKLTKIVLWMVLGFSVTGLLLLGIGIFSGASFEVFAESLGENQFSGRYRKYFERWTPLEERWDELDEIREAGHHGEGHGEKQAVKSFSVHEVDCLSIQVEGGNVQIQTGTEDEIVISHICSNDQIEYEVEDRELYIERNGHHNNQDPILIEIPETKCFKEVDLEVLNGNLDVKGKTQTKETSIRVESGNLEMELLDSRETDLECLSGNLSVTCVGKLKDYRVEVEADACTLELDQQKHTGSVNGLFGAKRSQKLIDVEGSTGNLKLSFENR